jgi:hypothetical protein
MDWATIVSQVGFPIGSALALAWFTVKRIESSETAAAARELAMVTRIRDLESLKDGRLFEMSVKHTEIISKATDVMEQCLDLIKRLGAKMDSISGKLSDIGH